MHRGIQARLRIPAPRAQEAHRAARQGEGREEEGTPKPGSQEDTSQHRRPHASSQGRTLHKRLRLVLPFSTNLRPIPALPHAVPSLTLPRSDRSLRKPKPLLRLLPRNPPNHRGIVPRLSGQLPRLRRLQQRDGLLLMERLKVTATDKMMMTTRRRKGRKGMFILK